MGRGKLATINDNARKKIAAHLVTNYQGELAPTVRQMLAYVPREVTAWNKIKFLARDEVIRVATQLNNNVKGFRDNTFVKVSPNKHAYAKWHFTIMIHSISKRSISIPISETRR
jgi:hypothetical protein